LFVGGALGGLPAQRNRVNAVMIGVGAAFDFMPTPFHVRRCGCGMRSWSDRIGWRLSLAGYGSWRFGSV